MFIELGIVIVSCIGETGRSFEAAVRAGFCVAPSAKGRNDVLTLLLRADAAKPGVLAVVGVAVGNLVEAPGLGQAGPLM